MPWKLVKGHSSCPSSKPWAVVGGSSGKRVAGCHPSRIKAIKQQRALYAAEASAEGDTLTAIQELLEEEARIGAEYMSTITEAVTDTEEAGVTIEVDTEDVTDSEVSMTWEGILSLEGTGTTDGRWFANGAWTWRDLPLTLMAQTVNQPGHDGAEVAGRIDEIWKMSVSDARVAGYEIDSEVPETASVVMGSGIFDSGEFGKEIARMVAERTLRGVSVDFAVLKAGLRNPDTGEMVDEKDLELEDILFGNYQRAALEAEIMAATVVATPAFSQASISVVASAGAELEVSQIRLTTQALVASAGVAPLHPPLAWFEDQHLDGPTPLTITDDGQIFGHLALWNSCHTGFASVCKAPPDSPTDFAYFNTGEIETAEGEHVACGKLMFCREGSKHAPLEYSAVQASRHYDDSTKIGGFVRAGRDIHGIYLSGCTRHDLTDEEIQYLRLNPPSGDWRPVNRGSSELVAAFSVPVGGFPIPRSAELRLVASGEHADIAALILSPPEFEEEASYSEKKISRRARRKLKALTASAR